MSEFVGPEHNQEQLTLPEEVVLGEIAQYIDLAQWPTIEEICEYQSIQIDELPSTIERAAETIASSLIDQGYVQDEFFFLAQCYHALNAFDIDASAHPVLSQLKKDLSSYESFYQRYMSSSPHKYQDSVFRMRLNETLSFKTSPLDILRIGKEALRGSGLYKPHIMRSAKELDQKWVQLRQSMPLTPQYGTTYVTDTINHEMKSVQEEGPSLPEGLIHATTSAALNGIAKHGALLSRTHLTKRGDSPRSGERADVMPRIYADNEFNFGKQYSSVEWFNEFPVQIEFHDSVRQYRESFAPDWGVSLGDEVPIDQIKALYVPSRSLGKVEDWVNTNLLSVAIRSIELVLVLQRDFKPR
jgi:hypothetical protein